MSDKLIHAGFWTFAIGIAVAGPTLVLLDIITR